MQGLLYGHVPAAGSGPRRNRRWRWRTPGDGRSSAHSGDRTQSAPGVEKWNTLSNYLKWFLPSGQLQSSLLFKFSPHISQFNFVHFVRLKLIYFLTCFSKLKNPVFHNDLQRISVAKIGLIAVHYPICCCLLLPSSWRQDRSRPWLHPHLLWNVPDGILEMHGHFDFRGFPIHCKEESYHFRPVTVTILYIPTYPYAKVNYSERYLLFFLLRTVVLS